MQFLKEWVRGLVALLLLATCLELLVPMNRMKKYVRMSMGLLVVFAVTRPVLGLLGHSVAVDPAMLIGESGRLPSVAEVMAQGEAIRSKSQQLAAAQAKSRLEAEAVSAAELVSGVAKATATAQWSNGGKVQLERVRVVITKGERPAGFRRVAPVEPVKTGRSDRAAPKPPGSRPPTTAEAILVDQVSKAVATRLGMETARDRIEIMITEPETGR